MVNEANLKEQFSKLRINDETILPKLSFNDSITGNYKLLKKYQHNFLSFTNQLILAFNRDEEEKIISQTLDLIKRYISEDLSTEEKDMKKHKYPSLNEHRKKHKIFADNYNNFKNKLSLKTVNKKELAREVLSFLGNWWIDHIEKEDLRYCEYVVDSFYSRKKN
jgi:hemerythrin